MIQVPNNALLTTARNAVAGTTLAAVLAVGCGIPVDGTPRAVSATSTTTTTAVTSTTVLPGPNAEVAFLYFLSNDEVVTIAQDVTAVTPRQVLMALFDGTAQQGKTEIVTQIPNGTRLLGVDLDDGLLTVDVSEEFDNLLGPARTQASAQIVLTATEVSMVEAVSITIEGQQTLLFSPDLGDTDVVGQCDYYQFFAPLASIEDLPLTTLERRHLTTRTNALSARC